MGQGAAMMKWPMRAHGRKLYSSLLGITVVAAVVAVVPTRVATATGPGPIAVTPYSGFNPILTRAPYVTDLTQTSADVNWATTTDSRSQEPSSGDRPGTAPEHGHHPPELEAARTPPVGEQGQASPLPVQRGVLHQRVPVHRGPDRPVAQHDLLLPALLRRVHPVDLLAGSLTRPAFTTLDPAGSSSPVTFDVVGDLGRDPPVGQHRLPQQPQHRPGGHRLPHRVVRRPSSWSPPATWPTAGVPRPTTATWSRRARRSATSSGRPTGRRPAASPSSPARGTTGRTPSACATGPKSQSAVNSNGAYAYDSYPGPDPDGTNPASYPDAWYAFSTGTSASTCWTRPGPTATSGRHRGRCTGEPRATRSTTTSTGPPAHPSTSGWPPTWPATRARSRWPSSTTRSARTTRRRTATPTSRTAGQSNPQQPRGPARQQRGQGGLQRPRPHLPAHRSERRRPVVNYVTGGGGAILEPVSGGSTCAGVHRLGVHLRHRLEPDQQHRDRLRDQRARTAVGGPGLQLPQGDGERRDRSPSPRSTPPASPSTSRATPTRPAPTTVIDTPAAGAHQLHQCHGHLPRHRWRSTFTCSLDGATATACTSPVTYTGLAQGAHTLR